MNKEIELEVKIEREVTYKEDSNWANYACVPARIEDYSRDDIYFNKYGNLSCVGKVHKLNIGAVYKLKANIVKNPTFGYQYQIISMTQDLPTTPEQQKEYIRMMVTPLQFKSIYEVYDGCDIIQMLKDNTFDYKKVYGFGEVTYQFFRDKILDNIELQEIINEFPMLSDYSILKKLRGRFSTAKLLAEKLKENPYIMTDFAGIGFKTADKIALELGIENDSPFRIHSAIRFSIKEVEQSGDTYIEESKLISSAYELLKVKKTIIKSHLEGEIEDVIKIGNRFSMKKTFNMEVAIAKKLKEIQENKTEELNFDVESFISSQEDKYNIKLTDQQKSFFYNVKSSNVNFLVGYAGCGKSMLQKLLINLLEKLNISYRLLAPTGKASKVLSKYTGRDASTVHRAIGIGQDEEEGMTFVHEEFIIIDESSMCDVALVKRTLERIACQKARILFIGDSFQIPSVSAGNFLYDCQESGIFPVTMLDIVFRQSEGGILDLVTKVRKGEKFIDDDFVGIKMFGKNCCFIACPQSDIEDMYIKSYRKLLKSYTIDDIMVLSPTKKGRLGTFSINNNLQNIVNPKEDEFEPEIRQIKEKNEVFFRANDRIINTVNTYRVKNVDDVEIDIMNGDTGIVLKVDPESKESAMMIDFEGSIVDFSKENLVKILHSLCLTMHKSQGSSAKAVLSISDKSHTFQLNANLLYVAWSRPEEYLVIIGQPKTINQAMKKVENLRRNTFLCEILRDEISHDKINVYSNKTDEDVFWS